MLPSVVHASARHRPGSLVGDAISLLHQVDVAVLRDDRFFRLYEIETNAGKATKALVRLSDVLVTAGQPPGGLVVVVDDRQIDRLRLELQRPTLRPLRGFGRILPFSKVEDPLGP